MRTITIDVAHLLPAGSTGQPGAASLEAPVVQGLKKREALVHLLVAEVSFVHCREGDCAFVARVEVCVGRVEELVTEV